MNLDMLDMYCASLICEIEVSRNRISDNGRVDLPSERTRSCGRHGILASIAKVLGKLASGHRPIGSSQLFAVDR
jgi:hypothetical protein